MQIKKALITAAGFGTRFLPITKTIEKEMLPVLNKPVIDYLVDDCIKAGIREFVIVINEFSTQIRQYYSPAPQLYAELERLGKHTQVANLTEIHTKATFTFVVQPRELGYGTAVPLLAAESHFESEDAFLVLMGDNFLFNGEQFSETQKMITHFTQAVKSDAARGLLTCMPRPESELSAYGVARVEQKNGFTYLHSLVEKPSLGTAPSNLANISMYIVTPDVFAIARTQQPNEQSGELYITDTIQTLAQQAPVVVYTPTSEFLDCGTVEHWLASNARVAIDNL